jgi:hypothetical protein
VISIEARGRLGNHLFQFAFGLAAATRLGTTFAMNDELLRPAFRLGPWGSPIRRAKRAARYRITKKRAPLRVVKVDYDDDPNMVLQSLADNVHYAGFFQSLEYFADVQLGVRAAFEPRARHVERFREAYGTLASSPYVCCHVRGTDYEPAGWVLPTSYYRECLRLADVQEGTPIAFVGDDLEEVEREFAGEPGVRFERNDEIVDLQLLINAAVVVTSNSSFGWWGSWLGAPGRVVYAPKYWLGFKNGAENPRAVVPPEWRQVSVGAS